jgi:hypothetical protein
MFDVDRIRYDFPILKREVYGKPLVYLDNAASAQKPKAVIDAMMKSMSQNMPMFIVDSTTCPTLRRRLLRMRGNLCAASSMRHPKTKSSSPATPPRR